MEHRFESLFAHLKKPLLLIVLAGIPAAAAPLFFATAPFVSTPELCFTAGSTTYQVTPRAPKADFRVRVVAAAAKLRSQDLGAEDLRAHDLRVQLVDDVDAADLALVDDVTASPSACDGAGDVKTVEAVEKGHPADMAVSLSRESAEGNLKLFVHSDRFALQDAAALLAAMRHYQGTQLALVH